MSMADSPSAALPFQTSAYRQPLSLNRTLAPPCDVGFEKLFRSSGRCRKISPCFSGQESPGLQRKNKTRCRDSTAAR